MFKTERELMFESLNFLDLNNDTDLEQNFLLLMNNLNGDSEVSKIICDYINPCFDIRHDSRETNKVDSDIAIA